MELGKEEEDPVLALPEVLLTRGSDTVAEACDEKDITLDPADEPDWVVDNNSMVHPKEAEEISTEFPLDTKVSVPDQDDVDKLPQHSVNKEPVVVPDSGEEACSCSDVSVHLFTKPMHKDSTYNEIEVYANISSEMCIESPGEVKENVKLQEQDNLIPFSEKLGNLNESVYPSEKESFASEDSGVSFDSVNQVLCDSALSEDSSVIFNEFSKKGDVSKSVLLEKSTTEKSPLYSMDSNVNENYQLSSQNPSNANAPDEGTDKTSGRCSPGISKTELRRRKRQAEKEAIAKKVQKMKEKQIASEKWITKKALVFRPLAITVGVLSVGVVVFFFYQYFNV